MFKIGKYNSLYTTKEVFDIFFCRKDIIEFATQPAEEMFFSVDKESKNFVLEINCGRTGNIEDYFLLLSCINDPSINMTIYLRGQKTIVNTGEEQPLCFQISNIDHCEIAKCGTKMGQSSCAEYKMKIYFKTIPIEIKSENCPMFDYDRETFERVIEYKNKRIPF